MLKTLACKKYPEASVFRREVIPKMELVTVPSNNFSNDCLDQ